MGAVALGTTLATTAAVGQTRFERRLVLSFTAGASRGGDLWNVNRQLVLVRDSVPARFDTVSVGRSRKAGVAVTVGLTYQRWPHVALTAEGAVFHMPSQQSCTGPAAWQPDRDQFNRAMCSAVNALRPGTGLGGLLIGARYRFTTTAIQPWVQAAAGLASIFNDFVETGGYVTSPACQTPSGACKALLYQTGHDRASATWLASAAAGVTFRSGRLTRIRLEARELLTSLPVMRQAASPSQVFVQTERALVSVPMVSVGVELTLVRSRERRY